jgi:hypothetical protein
LVAVVPVLVLMAPEDLVLILYLVPLHLPGAAAVLVSRAVGHSK